MESPHNLTVLRSSLRSTWTNCFGVSASEGLPQATGRPPTLSTIGRDATPPRFAKTE